LKEITSEKLQLAQQNQEKDKEIEKLLKDKSGLENRHRQELESVKRQGDKYWEELAITRAKLFLDQISLTLKVVPEYPDMLEDNREMAVLIEEKDK
jgi:inosine/xanthosine triphosphate pyrophosphatase family protein